MIAFGDSYSSGQGLLEEVGLSYNCGTDMKKARYRKDTTVLAKYFWTSTDCDTRTLSSVQPSDLYRRGIAVHENMCHRHGRAYPTQLRSTFSVASKDFLFLACSGATTEHVGLLKKKVAQYPNSPANVHGGKTQINTATPFTNGGEPNLVTIGIGGNDAGFDGIIGKCIYGDCLQPDYRTRTLARIRGTVYERLTETFSKLRNRYKHASVLAFGYPKVVGDPDQPCAFVGTGSYTLSGDELNWIKTEVEPALNLSISTAAAKARVAYINIEQATRGHELCSDTDDRWINGLLFGDDIHVGPIGFAFESFHPNQRGHDAIARYVVSRYTDGNGGLLTSNPAFLPLDTP
jgi:lysophospholipase L1-like esterase